MTRSQLSASYIPQNFSRLHNIAKQVRITIKENIMGGKPHSKTVRGTLDNPKTKEAIQSNKTPPTIGDPTSLKYEGGADDKQQSSNDSAASPGQGNNACSKADIKAPTPSNASGELPHSKKQGGSNSQGELPHSKKVRGTLSNNDGQTVNKTQLGDPVSLKAETSNTNMGIAAEREGQDKSVKSKL